MRALFTVVFGVAGCGNPLSSGECVSVGVSGIVATVIDAQTRGAPTSSPRLSIIDGSYVETFTQPIAGSNPPRFAGAVERPGSYRVEVSAVGYLPSVRESVVVTRGGSCNYLRGANVEISLVAGN